MSPAALARPHGERAVLIVFLDGVHVGSIRRVGGGSLRFTYDESWRRRADAYPLSLSLPLTATEHRDPAVSAFLWGLLPDNERTLGHYGRLFGVSAGSAVALLSHIGIDCAGAVQLIPPERADELTAAATRRRVEWLDEAEVARALRDVREQGIPGHSVQTVGQFSLAGAQPKVALVEENGHWGRPVGRTPTTTILKPPSGMFRGFAENEHLCLELASRLDLGAVGSRVMHFEGEIAIVVDRFDRQRVGRTHVRVHQEDVCQALGVMPTSKYESDGGPGIRDIILLLREASRRPHEDIERFLRATALNWVIAATDAHAKNYALLHQPGGGVRLAPFYDILSYLPYAEPALHRVKLAMKIGSVYLVRRVNRRSWAELARANGLGEQYVMDLIDSIIDPLPSALGEVAQISIDRGLDASIVEMLTNRLLDRVSECATAITRTR